MLAWISFKVWFDFAVKHNSQLSWLAFFLGWIPVLIAQGEIREKIKQSKGWKRWLRRLELCCIFFIPVIAFIATKASEGSSDVADAKIARLEKANREVAEKAGTIDPLKQPVVSVSAFIRFSISSHVEPNIFGGHITFEQCGKSDGSRQSDHDLVRLALKLPDKFSRSTWESGDGSGDNFEFEIPNRINLPELESANVGDLVNGWDCLRITTWLFPTNTVIGNGSVTLTLNSVTQIHFEIPSQTLVGVWPLVFDTPTGLVINEESREPTITGFRFDPKRRRLTWDLMSKLEKELQDSTKPQTEIERMAREYTKLLRTEFRGYRDLPSNVIVIPKIIRDDSTNVMPSAPLRRIVPAPK